MSDNKELFDEELTFDEDIDFDGLEDFDDEADFEDTDDVYNNDTDNLTENIDYSDNEPDVELITESDLSYSECDEDFSEEDDEGYELPEKEEILPEEESVSIKKSPTKEEYFFEEQISAPLTEYKQVEKSEVDLSDKSKSGNILINKFCIINTAVSAVTLCAVAAGIVFGYNYINSIENDLDIKNAEIAKLEEKNSILEADYIEAMNTFEEASKEEKNPLPANETEQGKIIFYDSSVGYSWVPTLSGIKQNDYINENFSIDNRGRISYTENGENSSYFGIDVSSYQGDIDWQLVKEDNVEFAFLRIGYRGYGEEGKLCPDEKFVANYDGAHDAGIDLGIYFFSQATSVDEAVEEANYVLSLLENRTLEYPIVFDWETVQTGDPEDIPRTEDVMPSTLTLSAIAFCETIRDAGYDAMIYTNKKLAAIKYDLRMLSDYPIWLAYYDTTLNYCYDFDIWQYGTGQVDGIEGEVDINIAMIK